MSKKLLVKLLLTVSVLSIANSQAAIQTINFDTDAGGNPIDAPNLFNNAASLTELYAGLGVHFSSLNRVAQSTVIIKDGIEVTETSNVMQVANSGMGSILNENANFGHNAKSGDNFLAFNKQSESNTNFWRISFDDPIGYFGISYSNGQTSNYYEYFNIEAYDVNGDRIGSNWSAYSYGSQYFSTMSFKSSTEIAYIDIGQGIYCCGPNATVSTEPGNWSKTYDDLLFGSFSDAPLYIYDISGNYNVPLPGAVWMMLSGLLGISRLMTPKRFALAG